MGRVNSALLSMNRGEVAKAALARVDLERMRLSAETQCNFMPIVIGPMMLRPGTRYIGETRSDLASKMLPFVFSNSDISLLELTDSTMRIWNVSGDTETLLSRASVSSVVTNGDFSSGTGWTLAATDDCTADINSTVSGALYLAAIARGGVVSCLRSITVAGGDQNVAHALRIVVTRGPVTFMVGSTSGGAEYIARTILLTGTHSLVFTPTGGTAYVKFESSLQRGVIVDSITVESSGTVTLPTPWPDADLSKVRYHQSGDIIFIACDGHRQRKIERRNNNSWSVVFYQSDDGPFSFVDTDKVTLTPSVYEGNGTLTASRPFFTSAAVDVGRMFRIFANGQTYQTILGAQDALSESMRIAGVGAADRGFTHVIAGTWVGTIALERSVEGKDTGFKQVNTYTANGSTAIDDHSTYDNSVVWYRLRFKAYTSGTATVSFTNTTASSGGDTTRAATSSTSTSGAAAIVRVTDFTSQTVVSIEILKPFSDISASDNWMPNDWSAYDGYPSAVRFHDGRLWWAGRDRIWGSVSDAYDSFDIDQLGDSGPINRSVGFGPIDTINWLLDLSRLIVGREGAETSVRSGSFDEPLTPTNFTLKDCSTQGSAAIAPVKIDTRGVFIQQSNRRVYELGFAAEFQDYVPHDLTRLNSDIGMVGFVDLAVQRQLDTQLHFVRADGQVAALLHDIEDQVEAWWRIDTSGSVSGTVESVVVLPGLPENRVYYVVKRTIGGVTKRFIERLAKRDQCTGLPEARLSDCHIVYTGGTTTVTGLTHLEGQSVVAWGWNNAGTVGSDCGTGLDGSGVMQTLTVTSGQVTIPTAFDNVCVGLPYTAQFKSSKLAYAAQMGTALGQKKKLNRLGLCLTNCHYQGLRFGSNFTRMDNLPLVVAGATVADGTVHQDLDLPMLPNPGGWDTDSRLCMEAASPRPCMVMAAIVDVTTDEQP